MCLTLKMPQPTTQENKEEIAAPTQADAAVTKAAQGTREKTLNLLEEM